MPYMMRRCLHCPMSKSIPPHAQVRPLVAWFELCGSAMLSSFEHQRLTLWLIAGYMARGKMKQVYLNDDLQLLLRARCIISGQAAYRLSELLAHQRGTTTPNRSLILVPEQWLLPHKSCSLGLRCGYTTANRTRHTAQALSLVCGSMEDHSLTLPLRKSIALEKHFTLWRVQIWQRL